MKHMWKCKNWWVLPQVRTRNSKTSKSSLMTVNFSGTIQTASSNFNKTGKNPISVTLTLRTYKKKFNNLNSLFSSLKLGYPTFPVKEEIECLRPMKPVSRVSSTWCLSSSQLLTKTSRINIGKRYTTSSSSRWWLVNQSVWHSCYRSESWIVKRLYNKYQPEPQDNIKLRHNLNRFNRSGEHSTSSWTTTERQRINSSSVVWNKSCKTWMIISWRSNQWWAHAMLLKLEKAYK